MPFLRVGVIIIAVTALVPGLGFGQKREFVELQRDVASLQDQVRNLERSLNENMGRINGQLLQAIDSINKANTSVAVLDAAMREREKTLAAPLTSVGAKMDQMASEFQALRVTMDDLSGRLGKVQQGLVDLNNTVKVLQAPPAPPPPVSIPAGAAGAAGPPSGLTAESLYANAMRDKDAGSYDVALQEFNDYLKYFGTTELAPNAQYYIGEIYYSQKDYDNALGAFDAVLERFPENNKTLDARFMKGRALFQKGDRTRAAQEFREVYRREPRSEIGSKAKAQLANMGLSVNPPASKKRATRK
ncbi:MAG: tetratricopeptide repeat protein [Bryobacteraceae bacterium]